MSVIHVYCGLVHSRTFCSSLLQLYKVVECSSHLQPDKNCLKVSKIISAQRLPFSRSAVTTKTLLSPRKIQQFLEEMAQGGDSLKLVLPVLEGLARERDAQLELVSLREGLQTKDAEIAVQRERVRTTEEEVRVKAAEITAKDALLQNKERMVQSLWREVESLRQRGLEQVCGV